MYIRLSLVIPTYNCAGFLRDTLDSALCQLPDDCEVVAVDDGSSDETPAILMEYEKRYRNLKVFYNCHSGVSAARNTGIEKAEGEWLMFMDCDDMLKEGFFSHVIGLIGDKTDLFIFSFERVDFVDDEELVLPLMVEDKVYETASEFADDYVRTRHLLIYSACNKIYRKSMLDMHSIRFRDGMSFGEDRLFNYDYLMHCGKVETSSVRMFRYMQRNPDSASKRSFPDYFDTVMMLHRAKMDCFLKLSTGTTMTEKRAFDGYDLSTEVSRMIERFDDHPNEKKENLPKINGLLFGDYDDISGKFGVIIVLGSRNCGYRVKKAREVAGNDEDTVFLVTGGNPYKDGKHTEAGFMAEYLTAHGIAQERIMIEETADNTFRNLVLAADIIEDAMDTKNIRIGIVTAGFHIPRAKQMTCSIPWYEDKETVFIPAFGEHTRPDNWYSDSTGRAICLGEIAKAAALI